MVIGYKRGTLSESAYRQQYKKILDRIPEDVWKLIAKKHEVMFLCYCRDGVFCHTHLIIEYACRRWPETFADGRLLYKKDNI